MTGTSVAFSDSSPGSGFSLHFGIRAESSQSIEGLARCICHAFEAFAGACLFEGSDGIWWAFWKTASWSIQRCSVAILQHGSMAAWQQGASD
jgi:hypothetical protein